MLLKFYYSTMNGCEWLNEEIETTEQNAKKVCEQYIDRNCDQAESLVKSWSKCGEENCELYPAVDCDNKTLENNLNAHMDDCM
jgi:hypothetical protein